MSYIPVGNRQSYFIIKDLWYNRLKCTQKLKSRTDGIAKIFFKGSQCPKMRGQQLTMVNEISASSLKLR